MVFHSLLLSNIPVNHRANTISQEGALQKGWDQCSAVTWHSWNSSPADGSYGDFHHTWTPLNGSFLPR